jgi:hypothetical protein
MVSDERLADLADRLHDIASELADLAVDELREAVRSGRTSRPATERRLTQARRSAEKAAGLLRGLDGADGTDG